MQGTMMALAKGKSAELTAQAIRELLIAMQGTHHNLYDDSVDVRDIADLLGLNRENNLKDVDSTYYFDMIPLS